MSRKIAAKYIVSALTLLCLLGYQSVSGYTEKAYVTKSSYIEAELLDKSKLNNLETKYSKMFISNPNNKKAIVNLANVQAAMYKLDAAEKNFKKVLSMDPKNAEAHNGLGMVYYYRSTSSDAAVRSNMDTIYNKAIDAFKASLKYSPNYYQAYNNLGKIYQEQGQQELAEQNYRKALDINPTYSTALKNLGTIMYEKGELDTSIDLYQKAIKANSKNSSAHYHLGEALIGANKLSEAIKSLQTSLYQFPNSAPVHDKLGEAYHKQGNISAALNEYQKAMQIKPEYTPPYLKIADIYSGRGDDEFAITQLKTAVGINPDFVEGKLKIADLSLMAGKTDQSIGYYNSVLNEYPNSTEALKGVSRAYYIKAQKEASTGFVASPGAFVDAENALRNAITKTPNDLELYLALHRISKLSGTAGSNDNELNRIISQPARNPRESMTRGEALLTALRFKEADEEFNRALVNTNNTDDVLYIADLLTLNGDLDLAKAAYNKAAALNPQNNKATAGQKRIEKLGDDARSKYRTGFALYKEGQQVPAIDEFRKSLSINAKDPVVRFYLAQAYDKKKFYVDAVKEYNAFLELTNPYMYNKEVKQAQKSLVKLPKKIESMKMKGEPLLTFDTYYNTNRF